MNNKIRICFVDDEPNILQGLKRFMRPMNDQWDMTFCDRAQDALTIMDQNGAFDVVVSDMRMPGMDGAHLLGQVQKRFPGTLRVILSGYAESESVMQTVGPAHLYLAKPCDSEALRSAIIRPLALRRLLNSEALRTTVSGLANLPSPSPLFLRLNDMLRSDQTGTGAIAELIGQDMAMTAEILKLTNSAYFGIGVKVTSILQAVRSLGIETIQSLVLKIGIFRQFAGSALTAPTLDALNLYGARIGALAEAVAASMDLSQQDIKAAHCAALLSSLGAVVLLDNHGERYQEALDLTGPDLPLDVAEEAAFGACHGHIGAYLLGLWGFADPILEAVAHAANPQVAEFPTSKILVSVHVARALGPAFPLSRSSRRPPCTLNMDLLVETRLDHLVPRWRILADPFADKELAI